MKPTLFSSSLSLAAALALGALTCGTGSAYGVWQLVWSDEFNGTSIASTNWSFEIGNGSGGWGNLEREYYTSRTNNAYVADGVLHIVARQESYGGLPFTSARMKTQNLFWKKYGRIEFRAKLPHGLGYWPALWMMGTNFTSVGWPDCGEIDVMESKGSWSNQVGGTIHYPDANNNDVYQTTTFTLPSPGDSVTNFHTYALEWTTNSIKWLVDGALVQTWTSWGAASGPYIYPAPFDKPFFLVMNLAVGGRYLGSPSDSAITNNTVFPGEMQVDYVRVYDDVPPAPAGLTATAGDSQVTLSWEPSTPGACYNVKRSLAGSGPFTAICCGLTGTTCTNSGLANGTPYYYAVSAVLAGCEGSNSSSVSATPFCPPSAPDAGYNNPVYEGMTLNLTASPVPGASYNWTGPNGFTSATQNPSITAATAKASGLYQVTATIGSCSSPPASVTVTILPLPTLSMQHSGATFTLDWPSGTLQCATNLSGPWSDLTNATACYTNTTSAPQQFYRLKLP